MPDDEQEIKKILSSGVVYEQVMEFVQQENNLDILLDIFRASSPNNNHKLFSILAKSGFVRLIVTTNFDQLIERSLIENSMASCLQISCDEEEIKMTLAGENKVNLIKIHGCISKPNSIRTTLEMISNIKLTEKRKGAIEHIFKGGNHKKVLVMGYSCSDIDIVPQIQDMANNHIDILYIHHRPGNQYCIYGLDEPLSNFPIEDRQEITKVQNAFGNYSGCIVSCDTDLFVSDFLKALGFTGKYPAVRKDDRIIAMKKVAERWFKDRPGVTGGDIGLIANIYDSLMDYQKSLSLHLQRIESVDWLKNKQKYFLDEKSRAIMEDIDLLLYSIAYFNVGYSYSKLSEFEPISQKRRSYCHQAIPYLTRAKEINVNLKNIRGLVKCSNSLAVCYIGLKRPLKALKELEICSENIESMNDLNLKIYVFQNLATSYLDRNRYSDAIANAEKALAIADDIGNTEAVVRCHIILGEVYVEQDLPQEAIDEFKVVEDKIRYLRRQDLTLMYRVNLEVTRNRLRSKGHQ
jgi:tetratricopeptide (TPR) repeat protein